MATPVEMPKLGNTVEECLLTRWAKSLGDAVAEGELIAEIETDKATFDVTAPVAGVLLSAFFSPGDLIPVFTNICVIGSPGEDAERFRPAPGSKSEAAARAEAAPAARPVSVASAPATAGAGDAVLSPRARHFAARHGITAAPPGSGAGGRVIEEDLKRLLYTGAPAPTPPAEVPAPPLPPGAPRRCGNASRDGCSRRWPPRRSIRCTPRRPPAVCWPCGRALKRPGRASTSTTWWSIARFRRCGGRPN
jgi:pyruvate dehydrogenase E2 component (dihydrolipoamide acetyltransferase)